MCAIISRNTSQSLLFYLDKQDSQSSIGQDKESKKVTGDDESVSERGANRKGGATDPNLLNLAIPRLSVCADAQKVDRAKLAQTEVN